MRKDVAHDEADRLELPFTDHRLEHLIQIVLTHDHDVAPQLFVPREDQVPQSHGHFFMPQETQQCDALKAYNRLHCYRMQNQILELHIFEIFHLDMWQKKKYYWHVPCRLMVPNEVA